MGTGGAPAALGPSRSKPRSVGLQRRGTVFVEGEGGREGIRV